MTREQFNRIQELYGQGTNSANVAEVNNLLKQYTSDKHTYCNQCPSAISKMFKKFRSWWETNKAQYQQTLPTEQQKTQNQPPTIDLGFLSKLADRLEEE